MSRSLRIGTRGSALALWQAHHIRDALLAAHPTLTIELEIIHTRGDQILDRPLAEVGGKGLFVKEIEVALETGVIDLAVHSLKDMPTGQPDGLELRVFPARAGAFDYLCPRMAGHTLDSLPQGGRVGTSSLRRAAQLRRARPDLQIVSIRGNVGTRLGKLEGPDGLDAIVLAQAGLERLAMTTPAMVLLQPPVFVPAPAQGALALEVRSDDSWVQALIDPLDDADTRLAVFAERAALHAVGGDCRTPFAAYAWREGDTLHLMARLLDDDGHASESSQSTPLGTDPIAAALALGETLGAALLQHHSASAPRP